MSDQTTFTSSACGLAPWCDPGRLPWRECGRLPATLDDADAEREASPKTCRLDDFFMDAISRRSSPSTSALVGLEYRLFCAFRRLCAAVSTR